MNFFRQCWCHNNTISCAKKKLRKPCIKQYTLTRQWHTKRINMAVAEKSSEVWVKFPTRRIHGSLAWSTVHRRRSISFCIYNNYCNAFKTVWLSRFIAITRTFHARNSVTRWAIQEFSTISLSWWSSIS